MKWTRGTRSENLQDRRGRPGAKTAAAVGIPGVIAVLLAMFLGGGSGGAGGDLGDLLGGLAGAQTPAAAPSGELQGPDPDAELVDFLSFALDDMQGLWDELFRQAGSEYPEAQLALFEGSTQSGCGGAQAAFGPHYCPADETVYIDLDFFRQLSDRYGAPGDFAQVYVLAHEIGHHVQNVIGVMDEVRTEQQANPSEANSLSVSLELQADCLAGIWANTVYERDLLERGDLREGLAAAAAVGDDRLQQQAGQAVNPESWTHGSSEERVRWFEAGFESGNPDVCDTF
ncbi:MAG: hypothetical protein HKN07_11485 [Acidimicrobiia bacterium]|nr:neutral zinc metallopeptidase [Acidimicrobiia bacterium]NNF64862.1 hypothetical protein [Acidimicrobiia bacterium]